MQIWTNLKWQTSHVLSEPMNCLWNGEIGLGVLASTMQKSKRLQRAVLSPHISGEVEKFHLYYYQLCINLSEIDLLWVEKVI